METKMDVTKKQELMVQMLSPEFSAMEKEQYLKMIFEFPGLFITLYEEIRGFKGEDLHIELR